MIGSSATVSPQRQWPLWAALVLVAVWGGLIARDLVLSNDLARAASVAIIAIMPPVLFALVVISLLRTGRPVPETAALEAHLLRVGGDATRIRQLLQFIDTTLATCAERIERLTVAASDGAGLAASAQMLTAAAVDIGRSGDQALGAAAQLVAALPGLERVGRQIEDIGGHLRHDTTTGQLQIINALLASVQVRGDEVAAQADAAIASINRQLAEVDELSRATTSRIAKRAYALDAAVDGALARSTDVLDDVAVRIAGNMATMDERLAATRVELEAVGVQGAAAIGGRLEQLHASATILAQLFTDCDAQNALLRSTVDDHLVSLPSRLAAARDDSAAVLNDIAGRTATVHEGLEALHAPLTASDAAMTALATGMARLRHVADDFSATLVAGLPDAIEQFSGLESGAAARHARIADLRGSIADGEQATRSVATPVTGLRVEAAGLGASTSS